MNTTEQTLGQMIETQKDELAQRIVAEQWARNPGFKDRYGEMGHAKCVQDVKYNLAYLSQAITSDSPPLFATYIDWVKTLFQGLKIPTRELSESLEITGRILQQRFPDDKTVPIIEHFIEIGLKQLTEAPEPLPSFLEGSHLPGLGTSISGDTAPRGTCGSQSHGSERDRTRHTHQRYLPAGLSAQPV